VHGKPPKKAKRRAMTEQEHQEAVWAHTRMGMSVGREIFETTWGTKSTGARPTPNEGKQQDEYRLRKKKKKKKEKYKGDVQDWLRDRNPKGGKEGTVRRLRWAEQERKKKRSNNNIKNEDNARSKQR
jgi:hypothetical protein